MKTIICVLLYAVLCDAALYDKLPLGYFIGKIPDVKNVGIAGEVYVVNETTILVDKCTYTYSRAPDMFFYVDESEELSETGVLIPTKEFNDKPIKRYENAKVYLTLPNGKKVQDFKSFGFWCRQFTVNFGQVNIDKTRLPF